MVKGGILFTGSSLMEQFPVEELAMTGGLGKILYNRGVGGYTTDDFLRDINTMLFDLEPGVVFMNIGTNDIQTREDGEDWLKHLVRNYDEILRQCAERGLCSKIYLMAYYPVNDSVAKEKGLDLGIRTNENIERANQEIRALADKYSCQYIDVNDGLRDETGKLKKELTVEGIHMYTSAYEVIYRNLLPYLEAET
ncbi:MAG: GDSL-type esterase/lipase family protein [Eubacteriales bacterium]|nr:GDSL-type esterase/lipase family protein [Eubacteriales bacterium]